MAISWSSRQAAPWKAPSVAIRSAFLTFVRQIPSCMQVITLLNFLGAVQGIFLGLVIFGRSGGRRDLRLLGALCLVVAVSILGGVLGLSGYYRVWPHLIRIGDPLVFLYGPLLYLYARARTGAKWRRLDWLHFIPFLLYVLNNLPFYFLSAPEKVDFVDRVFRGGAVTDTVLWIAILRLLHVGAYAGASFLPLRRYRERVEENFSNVERINLDWLRRLLGVFLSVCIVGIVAYGLMVGNGLDFVQANNLIGLVLSFSIYLMGYKGTQTAGIFEQRGAKEKTGLQSPASVNGYQLPEQQKNRIEERLQRVFFEEEAFLQSDLTVQSLADQMDVPAYQLSNYINSVYGENFYDFVNRHRVEKVKEKLRDPANDQYTILTLAFESGFNSKSTFNAVFKKYTGMTPSQYRKRK